MKARYDIFCISSIDWDFIWQGHQEIMSRLAADGHRVLFVENTGVRAPNMRDLPRVRLRIRNWWRGTKGFRQERPNLFIYSPLLLPWPYLRPSRWINRFVLMRAVKRWMAATGFFQPVAWTFLPTPLARDLIAAVDPQLIIYYCIDDFASSSAGAQRIVASEERLFREADLVFVTSEQLRERAARFSARVHVFPFGVSFEGFERVRDSQDPLPADVAGIRRPIVGYVGGLHQWVDRDLLCEVARQMPDSSVVLIGPEQADMSALRTFANVHLLGKKPHPDVPQYLKAFDVGLVPYRLSEYTANVYPTKLNEYLAMGTPVVATDLAEVRRFNADHGEIVSIAAGPDAYVAAIRRALERSSGEARERRIAVARTNSWTARLAAMSAVVDTALAAKGSSGTRWEDTLRHAYRATRRRAAEVIVGVAAVYMLLFHTSLPWWVAAPLMRSSPPAQADAIVVFAGGVGESGQAGGGYQERVKQALELYKGGYARYLVLSSGYVYSFREAEVMRALAVDNGVPASVIVLEQRAASTYQNVTFVDEILRDHRWRSILLVSSPYHMRRATMVWAKVDPQVTVIPSPPPRSQFYDHPRAGATLEQIRGIVQEYVAIAAYWRRGWL